MQNELIVIERNLTAYKPRFDDLLRGSLMDSKALVAGVMIAAERTPKLLECTPQSVLNCANTCAALHLPFDGASGQFFPLPFKMKGVMVAQPNIGYKGFNTIGARGGLSITAGVVREGDDEWDFREGSGGFVRHKRRLGNKGKHIAAWAVGASRERPDIVCIMGIDEILEIMSRSPAVRFGADTPWKDQAVGFEAMAAKTPRRRLARSIPWEIDNGRFLKAARVDEAFNEQGRYSYIDQRGAVVDEPAGDTPSPLAEREPGAPPATAALIEPRAPAVHVSTPPPNTLTGVDLAKARLLAEAKKGNDALAAAWQKRPIDQRNFLQEYYEQTLKQTADEADDEAG